MLGFQTFRSIPGLLTWEELRRHEAVMPLTLRQNAIPATLHSPLQCTGPHCMPTGGEKRKFLPPLYWQSLRLFHFLLPQARGMEFTSWFIFLVFLSWNLLTYAEKIPSNKLALFVCLPPPPPIPFSYSEAKLMHHSLQIALFYLFSKQSDSINQTQCEGWCCFSFSQLLKIVLPLHRGTPLCDLPSKQYSPWILAFYNCVLRVFKRSIFECRKIPGGWASRLNGRTCAWSLK